MTTGVAVFARAPIAGQAKTRLAPRLGIEGAATLQGALIHHTLRTAISAGLGAVSLWCAPDASHPVFAECASRYGVTLFAQQGADLGARMGNAFAQLCAHDAMLLIGTDCPVLSAHELRAAAAVLTAPTDSIAADDHECVIARDAVFITAEDGGYVLVGLRHACARVFDDIAWSSDQVMSTTRARLREAGMTWRELDTLWDVDRPDDLDRLEASGLLHQLLAMASEAESQPRRATYLSK